MGVELIESNLLNNPKITAGVGLLVTETALSIRRHDSPAGFLFGGQIMQTDLIPQFDRDRLWCEKCRAYRRFRECAQGAFVGYCPKCESMYRRAYFEIVERKHAAICGI